MTKRASQGLRLPLSANRLLFGAFVAMATLLGACGFTDDSGTKYALVLASDDFAEDETLAPIGALMVGEVARVTFEVTRLDMAAVDRTDLATITLQDRQSDDDVADFVLELSSDLSSQPYHTLYSDVAEAKATLCATYDGPEVLTDEPVETCMRVTTFEPPGE